MIIPKAYEVIKHKKAMDVCFEVQSFKQYSPNYYTIKGYWFNMAFDESFSLGIRQTIKIKTEDIENWQLAVDMDLPCLRYSRWKDLK